MSLLDPAALAKMQNLEVRARTVVEGALSGLHKSRHHGASVEFAEHKEYAPGDEIKHIDWKAYGKFDRYYIKRFEEETELKTYLVVDSSASMGYAGAGVSKLDYGRMLGAALAYLLLRQQDHVGLIAFAEKLRGYVSPRGRGGQLSDLLTALEDLQASGKTDLLRAIAYLSEVAHRRSLVIVMSDFLDGVGSEVRHLLRGLRARRHDVVVFQLLDRDELTLPFDGPTWFHSMEDERKLLVEPADVRRAYLRELEKLIGEYRRGLAEGDVEYHLVDTSRPPSEILLEFMRAAMSFLAPAFALFAILFVVPIIIHLIGRSRAKVRQFAALDLLLRSERKVARRTKLRQWLLLAVRALAIAAVPLILARPFMEAQSDLPAAVGGSQSAVIVLDDSLSMSYKNGERTLLDEGKARARRIVSALGGDAEAALLLGSRGGGAPVPELTADRGKLERALDEVKPTFRATDLSGALKRAAQILHGASRAEKRVYLISDLAAHGFERDPPWAAGRGPDLVTIDVGAKTRSNRAITDLKVETAPHLGPRGVRIAVEVANFAATPQKELPVTLRIDGKPVAKGLVDLDPGAHVVKRFAHAFSRAEDAIGPHEVAVELKGDALDGDDRRFARVEVRRDLKLLLVDGDPRTARREDELFYLETALRPGDRDDSLMQLSVATVEELAAKNLAEYDAVFLCNAKAGFDAAPLVEYVKKGGGLFMALGDNLDPDAWNAELAALLPQPLATLRSDDNARLQKPSVAGHPVLQPMIAAAASGEDPLRAARFRRYALLKPMPSDGTRTALLKLESGAPILVEGRIGEGRVLWWLSSIDRDWNDLPIQPAFLPLVQQAARYLARAPLSSAEAPALVGQRHEIPLAEGDARVEVKLPSGVTRTFDASKVSGRRVLGFTDTELPGVYRVAAAGQDGVLKPRPSSTFAVNVDAAESDPSAIAPARLAELRTGAGARAGSEAPKRRVELWHAMGAALLALLLVEALLLRRK